MKVLKRFFLVLAVSIVGLSCSKGPNFSAAKEAAQPAPMLFAEAGAPDSFAAKSVSRTASPAVAGAGEEALSTERKLVKRASLELRVPDLEGAESRVLSLVENLGGYVASTDAYSEEMSLSIRIPHEAFDTALSGLAGLGKTISRSLSTEDVTMRYYDLEGRLASKEELRETFRGYLKTAKTMEDILSVESRLNELQNEIDATGGQFRRLANLVDFASIQLRLRLPPSVKTENRPGLGDKLINLFNAFGGFLAGLLIVLIGLVVFGIPILALLLLLWFLLFGRIGLLRKLFHLVNARKVK